MFALEISFADAVSQPEMLLVRRPQALLGAGEYSHVVLEDMQALGYQVHLVRNIGRTFRCIPVAAPDGTPPPAMLEGTYDGEAALDLGPVRLHATVLDIDLTLREGEPADRAGVRILRQVCATAPPKFPAILFPGKFPLAVSFAPDQAVYIGRSSQCEVRLDASEISGRHARMGYESGQFWIEDLGSTNGTYVNGQQISGRVTVPPGQSIVLGREIAVYGVVSEDQMSSVAQTTPASAQPAAVEQKYPILLSLSEVARPARLVLQPGTSVAVGRDPSSDVWLGAPHISRRHLVIEMNKAGSIVVEDQSTNGTFYDGGRLRRGDRFEAHGQPAVFNFGGGVTVALCFSQDDEQLFQEAHGAPNAFSSSAGTQIFDPYAESNAHTGFGEAQIQFGATGTGAFAQAGAMYRSLRFSRKLLLVLVVFVAALVMMVLGNLMMGLL